MERLHAELKIFSYRDLPPPIRCVGETLKTPKVPSLSGVVNDAHGPHGLRGHCGIKVFFLPSPFLSQLDGHIYGLLNFLFEIKKFFGVIPLFSYNLELKLHRDVNSLEPWLKNLPAEFSFI